MPQASLDAKAIVTKIALNGNIIELRGGQDNFQSKVYKDSLFGTRRKL